jgi:hypothetical protein
MASKPMFKNAKTISGYEVKMRKSRPSGIWKCGGRKPKHVGRKVIIGVTKP